MNKFSHLDDNDDVRMVDVSKKGTTIRTASGSVIVRLNEITFSEIVEKRVEKGNILATAKIAGIQAAKKTAEFIPLCHTVALSHIDLEFIPEKETHSIRIISTVRASGQTGVEMEALTACSIAALTIYDMVKSSQKDVTIDNLKLLEKMGGKSGDFYRRDI